MITLVLYFALGFLTALFLAVLIAPAVWRRAVMLTRRRIEASVPLTTDEIRAEHDGLRARHAIEVRRLEMELKSSNDRGAVLAAKHAREREDVKAADDERAAAKSELAAKENELRESRDEARKRQARIDALAAALDKTEGLLQAQRESYEKLGREFEEASMSSSARQIELVARESEINRLVSDISTLKGQRRSADRISRDADGRVKVAEGDVAVERRRAEQLNAKVLQLLSTLSDREERLERREREIVRLRERLRPLLTAPSDEQHDLRLADLATENVRLEAELADLMEQIGRDAPPRNTRASKANQQATQNLREQMADIAARIVHMTALLEGARFPLNDLLEKAGAKKTKAGKEISLADRIRELQSAADGALSE